MAVTEEKQERIQAAVEHLFAQQIKSARPDWATFYRRVLGRHGLVFRAYPSIEDRSDFEKTEIYRRIQCMITELRKKSVSDEASQKDTKVITVRIPKALHEALADEARDYSTSVNKLCISKLLQFVDADHIPSPRREQTPEELSWMENALSSEFVASAPAAEAAKHASESNHHPAAQMEGAAAHHAEPRHTAGEQEESSHDHSGHETKRHGHGHSHGRKEAMSHSSAEGDEQSSM